MILSRTQLDPGRVETLLTGLLAITVGILVVPEVNRIYQRRLVNDVAAKLMSLEHAKRDYLKTHSDGQTLGPRELVPSFLDSWPCSKVGRCSDFQIGDTTREATFRGVALSSLEDPVNYLSAKNVLQPSVSEYFGR